MWFEFIEIGYLKNSCQVETCSQMNVIPPNTNLQCYNVTDKVMSVMSKNIDTGKINYVFHG